MAVCVEIEYAASPVEVPYDEEETSTGGVTVGVWRVAWVRGQYGYYNHPDVEAAARRRLENEDGIKETILDLAYEDWAQRDPTDWTNEPEN